MPIFEYNGKKYNVKDEHIDSFMKDFPDASTIMEREGKKYRVRSADYRTFMSEQQNSEPQQPEQPAAAPTVPEVEEPATPTGETPLTEQDRIRFSAGIEQMKRRTRQSMDDFNERMATMREYHENAPLGGGQTAEGRMMFNPQSGKVEKTYITPLGNRYTSKGLADMESFRYRQAADMSVSGQLRRARLKLAELQAKRNERASEVHDEATEFNNTKLTGLGRLLVGGDIYVAKQQSDPEKNALNVAIRQTEELIKDLEEQQDREQGEDVGFWRGFGRIAGDFRTWDFGMSDLSDAMTMMHADQLVDENATEGEREAYNEMMGALYNKEQAEQAYGGNASFWNRAGVMTGYMPSFMLDFVITGGGFEGISLLSKGGTRAATKVIGSEVVEEMAEQGFKTYVRNNGVRGFGQYAGNWTIKALGTMGDDLLIRAPLMTNTVQVGKTTSDIIDRKLGNVVVNEDGTYDFSNDETWGSAIWQGEANAIIENYSEMFGAHLDPVVTFGNMSKLANVVGAKRLGAVLSKADAGALSGIMGQTHQLFNKMGVSDYFGEVTEEYYGQMWRTMLNLDDAYQQNPDGTRTNLLATGQFHGDVWGGMALSMGLMGAGKHTLSAAHYTSMKHSVNKADAHATELLGKEVWEPLRTSLDLTTNEDMGAMAEAIVNDKDFTDDERAAVLTYMERSMMMRGYNLGTLAQRRGAAQDEDVQALDESYIDGYSIESSQEMNDAKNMYDYQRQRALAIIEEDFLADIENDPAAHLDYIRNSEDWSDEERGILLDYLNSKQVYDGMIQRVRDDIDGRIDQSNAMVNARTNRTTGMIQGATMKQDDRRVYVINGNLVQYADGSGIDIEASDNSIIVRDAETGALEQVSPDAILNIDEALDPITEMQTAADAIRQQYAQEAANRIDGVVTFNPGDTYTITGDDAQIQVQIVANDEGIVDNGDGTVNVSDGTNVFPLAKETIQQQAEAAQLARVAQFEQQRAAENAAYQQAIEEESRPQYALNDLVSLRDENGNAVRGNITTDADADGRYEVYTEAPINGKRVNLFTRDELDSMLMEHNGVVIEQPAENEGNNGGENIPENGNIAPQNIPAMQRIPKDMQGNPLYEQTDSDTAWDAIVEQTEGDEAMAQTVADGMVADKEAALKKLEKAKSKGGATIAEKIAAEKERKAAIDAAQQELNIWKKIAGTANRRRMDAEAERRRVADEAAALRKAEEERLRAEREEAERIEREALNGVPDMVDDTPQDARARGYRRVSGHKIDRQEPLQAVQGKEVAVRFSDDAIANGRVAVIDAAQLQPSHIQGVRNPLHFIDEAQPKERNDEASVMSARKIAGNIRPEEITSSVTAYTGAPTVNARGEAIQGNNRSDALRLMWESHQDQAAQYKQYLIDHAEEFGLNADDVAAMERPVLVNMLDVDDAEAITLGQFVAQDTESGGTERIKPKNALQKMGNDMRSFANLLLKSNDEDTSFAGLVDNNGVEVLKWMSQRGYITPTQYKSAFDSKGNLTAEAKNDLRGIMYQSIFKGGSTRLEEMFNAMPAKAQKAILATAFRDYDSPNADRMIEEIQNSIRAFYALSQSEEFVNAKTFKDARLAVEGWKIQYQIDDVTGESYLPAENFSNFALLLATMYKGDNQSVIQGTFNKLYDLIQGTQEPNLFEQPDNTPRTLAQAIYETLNITYDGQQRSNVLVGDSSASQRGQQGSTGDAATGERVENGERTADSAGSIEAESTTGGETVHQPQPERKGLEQTSDVGRKGDSTGVADDATQEVLGASNRGDIRVLEEGLDTSYREYSEYSERTRRTTESERLVSLAKQHGLFIPAEVTKTLTGKYPKRTGESVVYIDTAAGKVTKVKDPYAKSAMKSGVQPEDAAFEHLVHNLLFPETAYTLEGISEEMGDVRIVLSQDFIQNYEQPTKEQIAEALAARGLFPEDNYSFGNELVSVTDVEGDNVLLGEDGTVYFIDPIIRFKNPLREILAALGGAEQKAPTIGEQIQAAEAEVNTNPTEAQKEAGNYKKGHVQIGTFNVTIEQPKGSVRSGVDADGKKWETEMQNTYGYIRGTEGVDGDHIDVFLSDDIDGWDGHKVFVVDQRNADGSFDEHKVMLGFNDINDAEAAYMSNYEEGWQGLGAITGVPIEEFEKWIASSHRKTKAFAEYKSVKTTEGQNASADKDLRRKLADFNVGDVVRDYYNQKLYRIKKHSTNGVSTIAELDAEGNEVGTTTMNAHNNSRYSLAEAPVKAETPTISQDSEQVSDQDNAPYTIAPAQYTTKKGKVLDMHLVKFAGTLTKEQQRAAKELAKAEKGWYDREQGGFMMRSEESAKQLADTILNNDDAVSDAQPVSLADTRKIVETEQQVQPTNPSGNRLVTDERYAELRERMRKKLGGQMNIGIDPEILAIGTEMAVYHLEKGARKFTEYAKAMIADLGDAIRPYLKAFYNGARNLPEVESSEIAADMTPYDEVQQFNVATFDKEHSDPFTTAEIVVAEQAHQEEAEQAKQEIINQRNTERRNEDEQTSASTEAIASQAETVADKAESDIETATTEEQLNDVVATIDKQIEEVNKQLALLGYYEADIDDSQFHESYGYMRSAEKKAVKDADTLAKRIVKDLGIDPASIVDKKGKKRKVIAQANIAPAGGDISIRLPLTASRELYIDVLLEPDYEGGNRDNLFIDHIYLRIEDPTAGGYKQFVGRNVWVQSDATYTDMLDEIRAEIIQHVPEFDLPTRQSVSETEQKQPKAKKSKKKAVNLQQSNELGLFDSLFDNETNNEDGLQRTDAERSEGVSANGNRHEQGLSRGTETSSESEQQDSRRTDNGGERTGDAVDRTVRPRLSDTVTEQSIEGKPFEYEAELEQAKAQYEEYAELMKKELEQKEAKYAEMDATVEAANDLATAEEADELEREGVGSYTDDELALESDPVSKVLGKPRGTRKQRREFAQRERQRMAERVERLAKKLHLDNVEVVTDASTLEGKKQRAKGFYTKSTGKITIVIPNHVSTFDVEQTLLHEAVAHYGLRQLFGEHFETFLDNVFNNADEAIRQRIVALAAKNGWDFHKATEEYLAMLAENTEFENTNASWWRQIKDFFLNMLHKIGFEDFRGLTDNELRYILWRSYENLAEPGRYRSILGEAADVAKQYELGVGNYSDTNLNPNFAAESDDDLYRDGDPEIHERELARDRYERRVKTGMFQSQEALQDSMLGLKEAMQAILGQGTNIEDVDGFENAYLGENRLSSVNKAEADAFAQTLFKPMLDEVAKLARNEAEREELTDYMMAKHGLERNAYMRNEAINNGATDADQTDYAGLTALTGMDDVADAEAEAQRIVDDYEQAHDTTDLWEKVNAVSKAILQKSYDCGMMSKETFDKVSAMYEFYIPLRGFDEKTSAEAYAYLSHKHSAFNAPIKKAEGRRSKADDPFANLQSMAEGAIMQGNRNKLVKQRFLNFALNHPSDLVSVSDIWVEYDAVTDEWKPVFPDNIESTDTPEEVEQKMQDFETKMESLAQQYPDQYKRGKDAIGIPYRIVESRDMRQHQVVVKRGGRDYVITINGNPRAAQALNGQTNPDNDMSGAIGAILRAGEKINRQLSAFYTTRNPDFIVSNFMRDMLYTNSMAWIKESPNYALRFHRNYLMVNPVTMKRLLAKYRKGTLDMSNRTEAMFHQFMMNGGETGYANIRDIEQHKNDIRKELKRANGKLKLARAWSLLAEKFDELNRAVENCARFAAFVTSREMGRSIDRAIYDAKEISVNFNKKGSGAKFYDSVGQTKAGNASALVSGLGRSGYVFWNAAIQGTTNFGRQMKRHPAKAFTGVAVMFLLGAIVAYLGGDDDEDDKNAYYNLPEYVRRSNILFRAGDSWISIPLPIEYRAFYGMGELMTSVFSGKEHLTGGEIAEAVLGQATQILPIDFLEGGGGLNAFVPSAAKPLWEAYVAEKSWTGMPLYKDTPFNKDMPEWTKAYSSTNKHIVNLAATLNEATGGDPYTKGAIDINPAKVEYMLNGYFGGVFGTIDKLTKTAETIVGDREYDPRSILLVNRLVKAGDERTEYRAVNNEYFRLKEEHDRLKTRLRHYEEDTDNGIFDYAEKIDFLYNSPEYERYEIFEDYRRDIDDLYDEMQEAVDDEERKDIEAELNELKKEMIQEMNTTRKRK